MKHTIRLAFLLVLTVQGFCAQAQFQNLLHQADSTLKSYNSPRPTSVTQGVATSTTTTTTTTVTHKVTGPVANPAAAGITVPEMSGGIKQALQKGLLDGVRQVSAPDGFLKNAAIRLAFPPEARMAEKTLRSLGMNKICDDVITSLNRAAEDATKAAAPIFLDALSRMSIHDAEGILTGPDNSATQYFQNTTTTALTAAFKPVIESSITKVKADVYYARAVIEYNKIPFVTHKLDPDLAVYATGKATEGLFKTISQEEVKIRNQTGMRSTPLMKKVFGFFQKH